MALGLALLAAPSAHAARELNRQVEIEAKFVDVTQKNLHELGYDWVGNYNTSLPPISSSPAASARRRSAPSA